MLQVKNLHKHFGGIYAVNDCSFEVEKGSITALIGPNGAGKTTVFNLISGFLKSDKGSIKFKGKDLMKMKPYQIARSGLSRTFQLIRLFPNMTVLENMLIAMPEQKERLRHTLFKKSVKKLEEKNIQKALELLEFVDLHVKVNEFAGNLSYGQQKLLEIAKALASEPEILMLDEPASGVNPTMLNKIKHLMLELKKKGKTILFIEHNMEFVMGMADKVVVLDYGKEIAVGKPAEVQKNKKVIDAYLGVT